MTIMCLIHIWRFLRWRRHSERAPPDQSVDIARRVDGALRRGYLRVPRGRWGRRPRTSSTHRVVSSSASHCRAQTYQTRHIDHRHREIRAWEGLGMELVWLTKEQELPIYEFLIGTKSCCLVFSTILFLENDNSVKYREESSTCYINIIFW